MKWLKRIKKDRFKGVLRPNGIHFFIPADKPIDLEALVPGKRFNPTKVGSNPLFLSKARWSNRSIPATVK